MKCPHCLVEFHDKSETQFIDEDIDGGWFYVRMRCPNPNCERLVIFLVNGSVEGSGYYGYKLGEEKTRILIRPKVSSRPPLSPIVPEELADDYHEACLVLPDSPKASAALSRRCLQHLLRDTAGVRPSNLANEIQQVIDSGQLPSYLVEVIDVVRNIGNFAAHPIKSKSTGEIVPVEPGEAEWNLDVLEGLFDFYFVQPARIKTKRDALNAKLQEAGKQPMK